jgi:drug/metabolite transporter (DMT)-like permease
MLVNEVYLQLFLRDSFGNRVTYHGWTKRQYLLVLLWSFVASLAWLLLYFSLNFLPIGMAETLQNLTPFMTLIIAYIFLKETMKVYEIINMVLSFIGVLIIVSSAKNSSNSA